jgi:hypothetical protein
MAAEDIYDFEVLVPRAIKALFTARGIEAFNIEDETDFQNKRPRVEIKLEMKGEVSPKRYKILSDGSQRASCFRGDLQFWAISDTSTAGRVSHSALRANIRDIAASMQRDLNDGAALPYHHIPLVVAGNEETGIRSTDNYIQTTFPFTLDISIQDDAWQLLNS